MGYASISEVYGDDFGNGTIEHFSSEPGEFSSETKYFSKEAQKHSERQDNTSQFNWEV